MVKQRLVVIGNGMAGARAVEEVLARGGADRFDIVMFGDEVYGNYNRIMLSNLLNGTQAVDDIMINPLNWYAENNIRLHAGEMVDAIDRGAKVVQSRNGIRAHYDKLLIATGSRAFIPPMAGAYLGEGRLKPGVFGYRTIDDCTAIVDYAKTSKVAVTIGGGLLGLEAARAMTVLGCESHVVHLAGHLLEMQLDTTGGGILRKAMEAMGIQVHVKKLTSEVRGADKVEGLTFKDQSSLDCDMVIVAAGIRPNSEIGVRAGLTVERAIVVDNHMRSVDDPDVYVVGECAQHRGRVYGLVAPLWDQGKVFADHITEKNKSSVYLGSKLATKLKVMGIELASMGATEASEDRDEVVQYIEPKKGMYKKIIVRDARLVGSILMGDISKAAYLHAGLRSGFAVARGTPVVIIRSGHAELQDHVRRDARRCADLQLQRRDQGCHWSLRHRRQAEHFRRDGRNPRRQGLRLLQGAGQGSRRMVLRRRRAGRSERPLLCPEHSA